MRESPADELLKTRGSSHGDWDETARLAQMFKRVVRSANKWPELGPNHQEALDLITLKVARVLSGNPDFAEHWDDIIGYASLVARTLEVKA